MADCFITRRGGGSGGLNFEVVGGTTQPASPKENTIWVKTGTAITSWVFSAEQPTSPAAGMVWIKTGTSDIISFNAIKKNEINLRPNGAYQYISNAWVKKEMLAYQSGEWVRAATFLYENGTFYNGTQVPQESYDGSYPSRTYESTHIHVTATSGQTGYYYFEEKVDLTSFSTIKMSGFSNNAVTTTGSATWQSSIGLSVRSTLSSSAAAESWKWDMPSQAKVEITLDISKLQGEYYVLMYFGRSSTSNGDLSFDVQEVQLIG